MKCFYHTEVDAVAICKNCFKGLCIECASELVDGVACKGKCENKVKSDNDMIETAKKNLASAPKKYFGGSYLYISVGIVCMALSFGIGIKFGDELFMGTFGGIGALFVVLGVFNFIIGKRLNIK